MFEINLNYLKKYFGKTDININDCKYWCKENNFDLKIIDSCFNAASNEFLYNILYVYLTDNKICEIYGKYDFE